MGFLDFIWKKSDTANNTGSVDFALTENSKKIDDDIFKAYVPDVLYKPPFGKPRKWNIFTIRQLAKNPYVYSIIKTICDEITALPYKIKVKDEFSDDGSDYTEQIKVITKFFRNPNGNDESFEQLLRCVIKDILELDAGLVVKVFSANGEFKQIFARDGGLFLKNPDIYGYMGNRADFIMPMPQFFDAANVNMTGIGPQETVSQLMKQYDMLYKEHAAYFQYGWTAGSMPVPFGKREVIYFEQNPRTDDVYGRSPVSILSEIIENLLFGAEYNLDFYTNNNMPEGVISLLGANVDQVKQFRANWENQIKFTDALGIKRKQFYKVPITSTDVKFTPFAFNSKDMEILAQQQWFTKVLWSCFGVTAEEMGYTEDSNRAVGVVQTKLAIRKALQPVIKTIKYNIDTKLLPEFFVNGKELPDFSDIPVEFIFEEYDIDEDIKRHGIYEQELRMQVRTPEMIAKELGIDLQELEKSKAKYQEEQNEILQDQTDITNSGDAESVNKPSASEKKVSEKSTLTETKQTQKEADTTFKEIDEYIDEIGKAIIKIVQ